jgi:hypothetical protein
MNISEITFDPTVTPILFVSLIALLVSITLMLLSYRYWSKSFRPIVTVMVKTHLSGNIATTFNLEILNSGSLPAKNIQLKANDKDLREALGNDANTESRI